MFEITVLISAIVLMSLQFLSMIRLMKGPSTADRIIALQVMASKVVAMIVLIAFLTNQDSYLDVALVYAMMGFVTVFAVARYIEKGSLR
jgi:multicomponent Na+:H+ antiporter subunit F